MVIEAGETCRLTILFDNSSVQQVVFLGDDESKGWPAPWDLHYWDCFFVSSSQ